MVEMKMIGRDSFNGQSGAGTPSVRLFILTFEISSSFIMLLYFMD